MLTVWFSILFSLLIKINSKNSAFLFKHFILLGGARVWKNGHHGNENCWLQYTKNAIQRTESGYGQHLNCTHIFHRRQKQQQKLWEIMFGRLNVGVCIFGFLICELLSVRLYSFTKLQSFCSSCFNHDKFRVTIVWRNGIEEAAKCMGCEKFTENLTTTLLTTSRTKAKR